MPGGSNTCPECGGAVAEGEFCTTCMGKGAVPVTGIELYFKKTFGDFADKLPGTNIFYSYQIWEATDMAEYNALSASNKGIYKDIVNMGTVSLREDSNSRGILMNLFGAGTTTRANLAALLE